MISLDSEEEINKSILKTSFGKKLLQVDYNYIDETLVWFQYNTGKKNIRFSKNPMTTAIAYIMLMEIETVNITHIIEGVRYKMAKEQIQKLLII